MPVTFKSIFLCLISLSSLCASVMSLFLSSCHFRCLSSYLYLALSLSIVFLYSVYFFQFHGLSTRCSISLKSSCISFSLFFLCIYALTILYQFEKYHFCKCDVICRYELINRRFARFHITAQCLCILTSPILFLHFFPPPEGAGSFSEGKRSDTGWGMLILWSELNTATVAVAKYRIKEILQHFTT